MVFDRVVEILSQVCRSKTQINLDTELATLSMDSIDKAEFFIELEEEFNILVEPKWNECNSVQDVITMIESHNGNNQ